jgi:hypothetical protein
VGTSESVEVGWYSHLSVAAIFRQHRAAFQRLPGESSEFSTTERGLEWHCRCRVGQSQLWFRLLSDRSGLPVAKVYLVETTPTLLPAQEAESLRGHLYKLLGHECIDALFVVDDFLTSLQELRSTLGHMVRWSGPEQPPQIADYQPEERRLDAG